MTNKEVIELLKNLSALEGFLFSVENSSDIREIYIAPSIDILTKSLSKEDNLPY